MEGDYKFVEFDKYCDTCKHYKEDEADPKSKCFDCLMTPVNVDSHKPVHYEKETEYD